MGQITSFELDAEQLPHYNKLLDMLEVIEKEMRISVDNGNGPGLSLHLTRSVELLADTPKIMELAKIIHSHISGNVAAKIMTDNNLLEAKQQIQKLYIAGCLAKWDALYARAEKTCSALVHRIDGLRSLLSFEKSLINQN